MEVQLEMNFDQNEVTIIEPKPKESISSDTEHNAKKCKHNVRIKSFKKDYLSYCSKCGKILSVKHKKGE